MAGTHGCGCPRWEILRPSSIFLPIPRLIERRKQQVEVDMRLVKVISKLYKLLVASGIELQSLGIRSLITFRFWVSDTGALNVVSTRSATDEEAW